jgi:hypothetical protein
VNAAPLLTHIAQTLQVVRLEAILIGNAAAALHGSPVTTIDFDFFFRNTPQNLAKLRKFAQQTDSIILRPYYPISSLLRVTNDERGIQVDFMSQIHGISSFASLRSRSIPMEIAPNIALMVASLADIIKSKRAAARPKDRAVIEILEKTLNEKETFSEELKPKATRHRSKRRRVTSAKGDKRRD